MADCDILSENAYRLNYTNFQSLEKKADYTVSWNDEVCLEERTNELSWDCVLTAAKGMLHQYTGQEFPNLSPHYSPLNSCSYLLQQSYSQPSKIHDDCDTESSSYYTEDSAYENDADSQLQSTFESKEVPVSCETKELVPSPGVFDQTETKNECDSDASQMINNELNNNVHKSQINTNSYDYQKFELDGEESSVLPFIDLDMETIINGPMNENEEYKQRILTTANEINKICDENESNFRLPGFHQAFGSTEIGRFVHQKDFIEQTAQQPTAAAVSTAPILVNPGKSIVLPCMSPGSGSNSSPGVPNGVGNPKMKSRCNKRLKVPPLPPPPPPRSPAEYSRNACWEADSSVCSSPSNSNYYKRKDVRRTKGGQSMESCLATPYCSVDDYYNCSSSLSSASYYGGCSDYSNCDYYRYQQNSSQYHQNGYASSSSAFSNTNSGYNNSYGYAEYEHNQRLYPPPSAAMSFSHQNWRGGERFFPYNEQPFPYRYGRQMNSSSYMYQQFASSSQHHLPPSQQSYNSYGYNSYPPVPHYNYF